jgi:hypothetical protein
MPGGRSSIGNLRTRHAVVTGTQEPQNEKGVLPTKPQITTKHKKSQKRRKKVTHSSKMYYETQFQHATPNDATVIFGSATDKA